MMDTVVTDLWLFPTGIAISTVATALGIGGGIFWTPLLIIVCGAAPQEAVATSLAIQFVGLGSGSIGYLTAGKIEPRLVAMLSLAATPGVILGSFVAVNVSRELVELALGSMALALALVFVSRRDNVKAAGESVEADRRTISRILPLPAFMGVLMGFLSVGVGEWLIPTLRSKLGFGMSRVVATVVPVMFILTTIASLSHGFLSLNVRWGLLLPTLPGVLIGGQIGPRLVDRIDDRLLKETFAYAMTLVGIHLMFGAL